MTATTARGLNHLKDEQIDAMIRETEAVIEAGTGGPFAQSVLNVLHEEVAERARLWVEDIEVITTEWAQPWLTDLPLQRP